MTTTDPSSNAQLRARVARLEAALDQDASALRFLDAMDKIHRIARDERELMSFLSAVLDAMLELLDCDRAWLLYPCDPDASSWGVPVERTRPGWPGAYAGADQIPMDPLVATVFRDALGTGDPQAFDPTTKREVPPDVAQAFHIRSQVVRAVRPRTDRPWLLGIHHCEQARVYSADDLRIFSGIGDRVADALDALLALRTLEQSERRYRTLVEHAPEGIVVLDVAGRFLDANLSALTLLGLSRQELLSTTLAAVSPTAQPDGTPSATAAGRHLAEALEGAVPQFRWSLTHAEGRALTAEVTLQRLPGAEPPRVRMSVADVTEQLALQQQVHHLQKMETIGELAGGLAHDFNNQLLVVQYHAEVLQGQLTRQPELSRHAERIGSAAAGSAQLTRQLLAFSRRAVLRPEDVSVNQVVEGLAGLLDRLVGGGVRLEVSLDAEPVGARVDIQQLEQVLVNLAANARDALSGGGRVTLETGTLDLSEPGVGSGWGLAPGPYAWCRVSDDGAGMDAETLAHIFEPFFTTKERGKGTGLGLSTALGVVEQSGGTIRVVSAPGQGTAFTVYLPAVAGLPAATRAPGHALAAGPTGIQGGTVLVVEDHEEVGEVAEHALVAQGFRVLRSRTGTEALAVLDSAQPLDLLFTDLVLPGMDGRTLAERAGRLRPDLPVLFTSGHSTDGGDILDTRRGPQAFLQKPYAISELVAEVRKALGG